MKSSRVRIDQSQRDILELRYQVDPHWTNEEIEEMAERVGVSFTKIYKWNWERKKKERQFRQSDLTMNELAQLYPRVTSSDPLPEASLE